MNYEQTLQYLNTSFPEFQHTGAEAYRPGLERAEALDRACGQPHRRYRTIHVAGTNGKGSVSHMTAALFQGAGYRTGLFTSPHIKDFRERIRINGTPVPEDFVVDFVGRLKPIFDRERPSFFEMTSALAFAWFAEESVDFAVIETGLGGRLDSTNIITPVLSVITNIGFDHMALLGSTLAGIAAEKAGIIKPGVPVIVGESHPETDPVFEAAARRLRAPILTADRTYTCSSQQLIGSSLQRFTLHPAGQPGRIETFDLDLLGAYQCRNIVTVRTVLDQLRALPGVQISQEAAAASLPHAAAATGLRGRWQVLAAHPYTVCDIAHNAHGFAWIVEQWRSTPFRRLHVVLGMVHDKDIDSVLKLLPADAAYYFTAAAVPRALPAAELQARAARFGLQGRVFGRVCEALDAARKEASPDDMIYIGGSTFVVAEVL